MLEGGAKPRTLPKTCTGEIGEVVVQSYSSVGIRNSQGVASMNREHEQTTYVVGNWKMNGSLSANVSRFNALTDGLSTLPEQLAVAICVPHIFLFQAQSFLKDTRLGWGGQDVSGCVSGAFTGETAASMLAELGATFVLVGHSERRVRHGESDGTVVEKLQQAVEHGLRPIVCVGETLEEKNGGKTEHRVRKQLSEILESLALPTLQRLIVAYEPVWAIGTGRSASIGDVETVHACIREHLSSRDKSLSCLPILYGGSVNALSAAGLLAVPHVNGLLVGGASLDPSEFVKIVNSVPRRDR